MVYFFIHLETLLKKQSKKIAHNQHDINYLKNVGHGHGMQESFLFYGV